MVLFRVETTSAATVQLPPELPAGEAPLTVEVGAVQVEVSPGQGGRPGVISLPAALAELIPPGLTCRVRFRGRRLRLGPVVGIIGGRRPADLTESRLEALANHLLVRGRRGGLFVATDRESIDPAGRTVAGYHWSAGGRWEAGRYPLPSVLLRRYGAEVDRLLPALRGAGVQVFNERIFHKGEADRWMAGDPAVRPHLPETAPLAGPESVAEMLRRHPAVFVKPAWGSLAGGIVRVRRAEDGGYFCEPSRGEPVLCPASADMAPLLPRGGLVQQGLDLAAVGGRMIDFRVVVQKDGRGDWQVAGIVGRCGEEGLFVSNMATGGFPLSVANGLALLFGRSPGAIFRRRQELAQVAVAAARALERSGLLLGDLGLDLAYDREDRLWIIEANNRDPDHNIAWEAGDWPLFYRFRTLPLEYACHLAGFGEGDAP